MASEWCWKCGGNRREFRQCSSCGFHACNHCWKFSTECPVCKTPRAKVRKVLA